ncbi:MAG TPA: BadF/BadG/BcrA/BcrD ATPase family protein [Candidatus Binatia bacterium]|nr:BadF/BadG/BcrA/BcrD ATPase family protein [Candidatus Binatia bacterium]
MSGDRALLAVAGDNVRTDAAIVAPDGSLLAAVRGPGASPDLLGLESSLATLAEILEKAWLAAGVGAEQRRATLGMYFMAGVDTPEDEQRLSQGIAARRWSLTSSVANDVFASLWAANGKGEGVAVFVGSGINCVGRVASGTTARFLALGPLSGDWGDGESLGIAALAAAVRAEEGRGQPTCLSQRVSQYFRLPTAAKVAVAINSGQIPRARLLELVPLVVFAAVLHDPVVDGLLDRQADEIVRYVVAASRRLGIGAQPFDVVLSGSLLAEEGAATVVRVRRRLATVLPRARPVICKSLPVLGAALAGLAAMGVSEAAQQRLRPALVGSQVQPLSGSTFLNLPGN